MCNMRTQLKELITAKNVPIAKLARWTGLHRETISNQRDGKSSMSVDNLETVVKALGCKIVIVPME